MKRYFIILFLIFPIFLFSTPWTIMIYMNGDNTLEDAAIADYLEIANSNINTNVANILIQMDRIGPNNPYDDTRFGDWTDTKRFYVVHGSTPVSENAIMDLGELDMGDTNTLRTFISWGIDSYPADHYAVIVWNHGNSWYKNKSFHTKDFSFDDTNNDDSIGIANGELRNVLQSINVQLGKNLDIFGIDACISQTLTLAGEVHDNVDYLIASEDFEPGDGWYYTDPLDQLFSNPTESPKQLSQSICESYYNKTPSASTLSVLDMSHFRNFIDEFNILCDMWIKLIPSGSRKIVFDNMKKNEFFGYDNNSDLGLSLEGIRAKNAFTADVNDQIDKVLTQYDLLISTSYGIVNTNGEKASGITIYYGNDLNYKKSNLSNIGEWDDFLFYTSAGFLYPVYPNPAKDSITVSGILNDDTILIYSVDGQVLFNKETNNSIDVLIDISKFSSGIYFLLVKSRKNGIIIRKFAKVR